MPTEGHTMAPEPHTKATRRCEFVLSSLPAMALQRAKWTRIQHENKPSQGLSAIFWHSKDFVTAHEVVAGA